MRPRRVNRDPLRKVVASQSREGAMSIGMPELKTRWWELTLECGHIAERPARYPKGTTDARGWARLHNQPSKSLMLPAPGHARCESCR